MNDGLSIKHFKIVQAEITGRFFSQAEADSLKELIDEHTIIDSPTRIAAAKCWEP